MRSLRGVAGQGQVEGQGGAAESGAPIYVRFALAQGMYGAGHLSLKESGVGSTGAHRIRIDLDEEDLIEAYKPAPRPQRQARLALLLALALALSILALLVAFPGARRAFTTSPLIAGLAGAVLLAASLVVALLAAAPRLRRRAARSTLEHHPGMRDPMVCSFDHEHFALETTRTMGRYPWSELWDWRETERVIIVLPTPRNFYVLPKRQFQEGVLEQLRSSLSQCRRRRG